MFRNKLENRLFLYFLIYFGCKRTVCIQSRDMLVKVTPLNDAIFKRGWDFFFSQVPSSLIAKCKCMQSHKAVILFILNIFYWEYILKNATFTMKPVYSGLISMYQKQTIFLIKYQTYARQKFTESLTFKVT